MTTPMKVGIVGCGNISNAYLEAGKKFDVLDIVAVSDLDLDRAKAKAEEHAISRALSVDQLLADPEVEIVINLTVPGAHYDVCKATLEAGKHAYVEKPLSLTRDQGRDLLQTAHDRGLRIGGAPDTFLGAGYQTCRKLIDDGAIGQPIAATAFMQGRGVETWHPNPEFFFKPGGGPMFDMGPYYLTALISLLGPDPASDRVGPDVVPGAAHHQPAAVRPDYRRGDAHAYRGRAGLCGAGRSRRSSPVSTSGRITCPPSRSTARKARSPHRTPTCSAVWLNFTARANGRKFR